MAMPAPAYLERRLRARYHVQVELAYTPVTDTPTYAPVAGCVRRVFRGDERLGLGDEVHFSVAVRRPEDSIRPGGDLWMDLRAFEAAKYMEVFLNGTPPDCELADYRSFVIAGPSDAPCVPVPTEEEVATAWAEFHGRGKRRRGR